MLFAGSPSLMYDGSVTPSMPRPYIAWAISPKSAVNPVSVAIPPKMLAQCGQAPMLAIELYTEQSRLQANARNSSVASFGAPPAGALSIETPTSGAPRTQATAHVTTKRRASAPPPGLGA